MSTYNVIAYIVSNVIAYALVPVVIYLTALLFNIGKLTREHKRLEKRKAEEINIRNRIE